MCYLANVSQTVCKAISVSIVMQWPLYLWVENGDVTMQFPNTFDCKQNILHQVILHQDLVIAHQVIAHQVIALQVEK